MRKLICLLVASTASALAYSQDFVFDYSSSKIADSLKEGANTVMRLDEAQLDILSPSKYIFKVHQVTTILNPGGSNHLTHRLYFDKFRTVDDATIKIYNSLGILVRKYSKKDFIVEAAYDGISLATDDKRMELTVAAPGYPCTIDVQYSAKTNGYIELPDWYINENNTSTEICRYTITVPANLDIRHRTVNLNLTPSVQVAGNKKIYTWELRNARPKKIQENGFQSGYYFPTIQVAPNFFEYDGYAGQFTNWTDFGKWNYPLYQEKNPFTDERKNEIKTLLVNHTDIKARISVLYDYLKKNMRYVSIQFGIGGFKPFSVKYVDEKKYGDCKALTNYMRYLLDAAGIKSYPALINAGSDLPPVDPDFPTSLFNHVILCIPASPDTMWLECTSKDAAAGFLGTFTENKNALVLTENGGVLTKTPASKAETNLLASHNEIFITEEGGAKAQTTIFSTGDVAFHLQRVKEMDANDQKELFVNHLNYKSADDFSVSSYSDSALGRRFQLELRFDKLFSFKAGSKYFFPQKLNRLDGAEFKDEEREIDFLFDYPYFKTDTTIIHFPGGFKAEELPKQRQIDAGFASYKKQVLSMAPDKIKIVTSLVLKKHVIAAADYKALRTFFGNVNESEEENIVLIKQ